MTGQWLVGSPFIREELQSHTEDHKGRHAEMADHVQRLKQEKDWDFFREGVADSVEVNKKGCVMS